MYKVYGNNVLLKNILYFHRKRIVKFIKKIYNSIYSKNFNVNTRYIYYDKKKINVPLKVNILVL